MMLVRPKLSAKPTISAEQIKYNSVITIDGIDYTGKMGDWIITITYQDKKTIEIISDDTFKATYEPMPESDYIAYRFNGFFTPYDLLGSILSKDLYTKY